MYDNIYRFITRNKCERPKKDKNGRIEEDARKPGFL